ncbi:unnamed protein product [Malus baccata var. baccata]
MSGPFDRRFDLNFGEEVVMSPQDNIWRLSFLSPTSPLTIRDSVMKNDMTAAVVAMNLLTPKDNRLLSKWSDELVAKDSLALSVQCTNYVSNMAQRLFVRTYQVESLAIEVISLKHEIRGLKHENKQLHMLVHDYATNMKRKLDQLQKSDGQILLDHQRVLILSESSMFDSFSVKSQYCINCSEVRARAKEKTGKKHDMRYSCSGVTCLQSEEAAMPPQDNIWRPSFLSPTGPLIVGDSVMKNDMTATVVARNLLTPKDNRLLSKWFDELAVKDSLVLSVQCAGSMSNMAQRLFARTRQVESLTAERFVGLFQRHLLPSPSRDVPRNEAPNDQPPVPPPSSVLPSTEATNDHPLVPSLSEALPTAETSPEQPL